MNRPSVVLIPGSVCDRRVWNHQVRYLEEVADPFVAPVDDADTMPELAKRVLDTAPDRFALAGFSMGGYVALEMARQSPERITRLALLDTSARSDTPEKTAHREATVAACQRGDYPHVVDQMMTVLLHPDRQGDALADFVRAMMTRVGPEVFAARNRAMATRLDSRELMTTIDVPVRVICGRQDALSSIEEHEEIARLAPRGRLSVIEECGHMSIIERPHAATALIRDWLVDD